MLETVIKLRATAASLALGGKDKAGYGIVASTSAESSTAAAVFTGAVSVVAVKVWARAPEGECRFRLWDEDGRSKDPVGKDELENWQWNFNGSTDQTVELRDPRDGTRLPSDKLLNFSLTWSVRVLAADPESGARYDLRIKVLQDGKELTDGTFSYSGPLGDYEELTGRFHFALEGPSPAA